MSHQTESALQFTTQPHFFSHCDQPLEMGDQVLKTPIDWSGYGIQPNHKPLNNSKHPFPRNGRRWKGYWTLIDVLLLYCLHVSSPTTGESGHVDASVGEKPEDRAH
jgi:hypothetical protein